MKRGYLLALTHSLAVVGLLAVSPCPAYDDGTTITITNQTGGTVTLSDLYGYTGNRNTGTKFTKLYSGDSDNTDPPPDDIHIPHAGQKNFTWDGLVIKSFTISWLNDEGKEVETDIGKEDEFAITKDKMLCFFDAPGYADLYALDYDETDGALPPDDFSDMVSAGKLSDPEFNWITFYDVTASGGFIERDTLGNPTSPLLDGVNVVASFQWSVFVPEPATLSLLLLGGLILTRRWRR